MNQALAVAAALALTVVLFVAYRRLRAGDRMDLIISRKRGGAMLASPAVFIDGANHIPVALSLESSRVAYENDDLDASIDIQQIDEVEYSSDLVTGRIADGAVLRLRSHGRAYEFILDVAFAERWSHRLPPHRLDEAGSVAVV